jgi:hypothetical protein
MALYGLYSGIVTNATDPLMKGRLLVSLPGLAAPAAWAMPCREYKSTAVPPIGTTIWVMFEQGNLDHPVWMGCAS